MKTTDKIPVPAPAMAATPRRHADPSGVPRGLAALANQAPATVHQRAQIDAIQRSPVVTAQAATQRKANAGGLPAGLKSGIESLSGMNMDHVKVHYNSSQPAQLNALAYAQGSQIHVAPGQEKHLPHEAWHVVQQAQGRVKPTRQMKRGGVAINDNAGLEAEADRMGAKAMGMAQRQPDGRVAIKSAPVIERSAQLASASRPNGSEHVVINTLAALNQLLVQYGHAALTVGRIYKRFNIGGDDAELQTLGGWPVRVGVQNRFGTRNAAIYAPPVDLAIQAMTNHLWKGTPAGLATLHMGNQTTLYREDQMVGDIRRFLGVIVQGMPVVTHYTESNYSVSLAALNLLQGQVPAIGLERVFDSLGHIISGHAWGGTKILANHAQYAAELKINGSGATRIVSRNASAHVLDVYLLNGLHA